MASRLYPTTRRLFRPVLRRLRHLQMCGLGTVVSHLVLG